MSLGLAEAGVGRLVLVDPDRVERSNLQRQVLFGESDLGRPKVEAARERLLKLVPGVHIDVRQERLDAGNVDRLLEGVDIVVDATDDPAARFVMNDHAIARRIPAVFGGIRGFTGLVLAVGPGYGPCYRCLFEEPPAPEEAETCGQAGVIGALAGVVGHLQVRRALALLGPDAARATGFVTTIDGLRGRVRDVPLPEDTECPACGGARRLDITPYACPMTFVRTKLALERVEPGGVLDIVMRTGEPARNIPRSLRDEGHEVLSTGDIGSDLYRVVVRRVQPVERVV